MRYGLTDSEYRKYINNAIQNEDDLRFAYHELIRAYKESPYETEGTKQLKQKIRAYNRRDNMAQKDRMLTVDEVMAGHVSKEYLDLKEELAKTNRRIRELSNNRDFLSDKIDLVGPREDLLEELNYLDHSIYDLRDRTVCIRVQMESTM